jgi:DNA-binding SARP family transcriptional activator
VTNVEFRLLGPVEVVGDGAPLALSGTRDRSLIAALLLDANRVVSVDRLVASAWGADPPATARTQARNRVSVMRRLLPAGNGAGMIATHGSGYVIHIDDAQLDTRRFDRLVARADDLAAAGDSGRAAGVLAEALRLWRGPALDGLQTPSLAAAAQQLEEARARALERRVELDLAAGRHRELLAEVSTLAQAYPYRERLREYLMLALYRAGRQAEALETYRQTRALLTDQLGVEPGPALQRLHEAILRGDERLAGPEASASPGRVLVTEVPRQVPLAGFGFTGRGREIAWLDDLPAAGGIGLVVGSAGVGKTALAVHWAHRMADRFPDGQLYLDLRGYAAEEPMRPIVALAQMLRALGVAPGRVPVEVGEAAALYRSLLAGRRVLVLLDNAGSVEQVRPLLPGSAGCLVLVTSRDRLGGLVAREGAHRLVLDVLPAVEAQALLAGLLGADRAGAEMSAVDELARMCAFLPLALRIAAANLTDSSRGVGDYVAQLGVGDRLAVLEIDGDEEAAVRAAFDLSYRAVPPAAQRLFRLLGVVPGPDFTPDAAAALAGDARHDVARVLRTLVGAHLVQQYRQDRFTFHDLLRQYARECVQPEEAVPARTRLFEWYAYGADRAAQLLYPDMLRPPAAALDTDIPPAAFADQAGALAWLRAESPNLVAACLAGPDRGMNPQTWRLAGALRSYLMQHVDRVATAAVCQAGLRAAAVEGDDRAQTPLYYALAHASHAQGKYPEAIGYLEHGLALSQRSGWRDSEAQAYNNLSLVYAEIGQLRQATEYCFRALRLSREVGHGTRVAKALSQLGTAYAELGQLTLAARTLRAAIDEYDRLGEPHASGAALDSLGGVLRDLGDFDEALECLTRSEAICRASGARYARVSCLAKLATVQALAGRHDEALRYAEDAVQRARELEARLKEADATNALGMAHLTGDRHQAAIDCHRDALRLTAGAAGRQHLEALLGLATAYLRLGGHADALAHARRAADLALDGGQMMLEGGALTMLAGIHLGMGSTAVAVKYAHQALKNHRTTGYRVGEARALVVLGDAMPPAEAAEHWQAGLALLTDIGMQREAGEVSKRLAG